VGWLLMVHVIVGTSTPDEEQEMLTLPPLDRVTVPFVPAAVLGGTVIRIIVLPHLYASYFQSYT